MEMLKCKCFLIFLCYFLLLLHPSYQQQAYDSIFMQDLSNFKKGDNLTGLHGIKRYLVRFGYMSSSKVGIAKDEHFDDVLEEAIKKYQTFFRLNVSGILDSSTLAMMRTPRCGTPDLLVAQQNYGFVQTKWNRFNLTWALDYGTRRDAYGPITEALARWQSVNVFTFSDKTGVDVPFTDLHLGFYRRQHGDDVIFDGPGGIIGHAKFPPGGMVHFDADDNWKGRNVDKYSIDITTAALHELGHALGLVHTSIEDAIMFPTLDRGLVKTLHSSDIEALKALYKKQ